MGRLTELEARIERAEDWTDELRAATKKLQNLVDDVVDLMADIGGPLATPRTGAADE